MAEENATSLLQLSFAVCLYSLRRTWCWHLASNVCLHIFEMQSFHDLVTLTELFRSNRVWQTQLQLNEWRVTPFENLLQLFALVIILQIRRFFILTVWLPSCTTVLFKKLAVANFVTKFHTFYGVPRFITTYTKPATGLFYEIAVPGLHSPRLFKRYFSRLTVITSSIRSPNWSFWRVFRLNVIGLHI